jgi:hypothetical protein
VAEADLTGVFSEAKAKIDTSHVQGEKSDGILGSLCPGLVHLGYEVETSKKAIDKIERPVLFGDEGHPRVHYQIDAWLPDPGVVVEVEAGRGWMGGAFYRDLSARHSSWERGIWPSAWSREWLIPKM